MMLTCHRLISALDKCHKRIYTMQRCLEILVKTNRVVSTVTVGGGVMSGIQPTGEVHIGNYFGAICHWLELQERRQELGANIYSIVDLHAITVPHEAEDLRSNVYHVLAVLLACGLDPQKSIIYQQSTVAEHTQLAWILSCLTPLSLLTNLPEWKEKSRQHSYPHVGLCNYPVLQAADILLYRCEHVPVGADQHKHLHLARELCRRFNHHYSTDYLVPPRIITSELNSRLKSLTNPAQKMSKSDANVNSRILVTDAPDVIRAKIRRAQTDCTPVISYDPVGRAGVANLLHIYCACTGECPEVVGAALQARATRADTLKALVTEAVVARLAPVREEAARLAHPGERGHLERVLAVGGERARARAAATMATVGGLVGLSARHPAR